jgi:uncharacterized protein (TIGR03086 family)
MTGPTPDGRTPSGQFRIVASGFSRVAHAVPADRWDDPSPCEGWSARDVVAHMVEWMPAFLGSIGTPIAPGPDATTDPAAAWDHLAAEIQAVLDDPERAGREITHEHLGTLTVERAIGMTMTGDVLVHTWDVARATGGDETLPADLVRQQADGMEAMGDALEQSGQFGPRVTVPDDADDQTRMLALSGRRA